MAALVVLVTGAALLALAPTASAQGEESDDVEAMVVLTGRALVQADDTLETVVIFDGPAVVDGTVDEAVVAFNGDVRVNGTVEEDVVAFNGRVTVTSNGRVGGDVVSRQTAVVEAGGTVAGDVRRFDPRVFDEWFGVITRLAWWLAVGVSALLLGLLVLWLAPRVVDVTSDVARRATGPVVGWGLVALLAGPLVAVMLMVTLVGIPLGLYLLAALGVVSVLGYTTCAWIVGRLLVRQPRGRTPAFLAGLAVLRILALVPILGGLAWFAAAIVGTGALLVAAWQARGADARAPIVAAQH